MDSRLLGLPPRYFDPAQPVEFDEDRSCWVASTYDDVLAVLTDGPIAAPADPFPPQMLRALTPDMRQAAGQIVAGVHTRRFDVAQVAQQLPQRVVELVAALDPQAAAQMRGWAETTAAGIGNALLFLTETGHGPALAAAPYRLAPAVEEVLRWCPPIPAVTRVLTGAADFAGIKVPAGATVEARISAANRDPARFDDAAVFDITRTPNPHLSFGLTPHGCTGAPLARLAMTLMLEQTLIRMPRLRWDTTVAPQRHQGLVHRLTEAVFVTDPG